MSVVYEKKKFNRVGRQTGTKQVVTDPDGTKREVYVDESGNVIDNSYEANQVKEDSVAITDGPSLLNDGLDIAGGSLERLRSFIVSGANQTLRLEAGGYTPEEKVARAIAKAGLPQFAGASLEDILNAVKSMKK